LLFLAPPDQAGVMSVHIHNITFDCADARGLATFWSGVTGWHVYYDDDPEVVVAPSFPYDGTGLLFIPVPEGKTAKNRIHLDLAPETMTRDEAVDAAVAAGATVIGDHRRDDGAGWVTLADPEGNEFCLERSAHELGARPGREFRIGT
jgi:predicted enzyme related to lactoylglutathione lyase